LPDNEVKANKYGFIAFSRDSEKLMKKYIK